MPLEPGSDIGDYRVLKLAGSGGMGQVYKVQNLISNRIEALKVVVSDLSSQGDLAERFLREIQVHASLIHPNIASMHAALRLENQLVMVMEFVEGETLEELTQKGPLPVEDCLHYVRQILAALSYAHSKLVIHRDIKPANVIVTPEGTVKIMDFGLASGLTDRRLTRTGVLIGSLHYMAPEQVKGEPATPQTDLYSFGLTLYEMLTGVQGIRGDSDYAVMTAHLSILPEPPTRMNPAVPPALSELVLKTIAKDPLHRFQSAEEIQKALDRLSEPTPAAAHPLPARTRAWGLVAALTAVVLAAGAVAYRAIFSPPSEPSAVVSAVDPASHIVAPSPPPSAAPPSAGPPAVETAPLPVKGAVAAPRTIPPTVAEKAVNPQPVSSAAASPAPVITTPAPSVQQPVVVAPAPVVTAPASPRVVTPPQPPPNQPTPVAPATSNSQQQKIEEDARLAELQRQRLELEQASMRKEINDVLKRLEAAYASREIQQVRAVWPRLPADQRGRAEELFQQSRSVALSLELVGAPRLAVDRATVQCRVRLDNQLRSNSKSSQAGGEAAVTMVRTNGIWVIEGVQYTPGGRSLYRPF